MPLLFDAYYYYSMSPTAISLKKKLKNCLVLMSFKLIFKKHLKFIINVIVATKKMKHVAIVLLVLDLR